MLLESAIRGLFRDEQTYNFRQLLEQASEDAHMGEYDERILNTIELFAFGSITIYQGKPQLFLDLDPQEQRKLIELTILTVLSQNVGNEVALSELLSTVKPAVNNYDDLETYLINMIELGAVSVKIDESREVVSVKDTPQLRDAYNRGTYKLRVLSDEDVKGASVHQAKEHLHSWLENTVIPTMQSFGQTRT